MLQEFISSFRETARRVRSKILIFNEPEKGIEIEFVFGGEYTVEEFEETLGYLKRRPDLYQPLKRIVDEANSRPPKERANFVESLTVPTRGILVTKGAREQREREQRFNQFLIDINSMSPTNLANMQNAIERLVEGNDDH